MPHRYRNQHPLLRSYSNLFELLPVTTNLSLMCNIQVTWLWFCSVILSGTTSIIVISVNLIDSLSWFVLYPHGHWCYVHDFDASVVLYLVCFYNTFENFNSNYELCKKSVYKSFIDPVKPLPFEASSERHLFWAFMSSVFTPAFLARVVAPRRNIRANP